MNLQEAKQIEAEANGRWMIVRVNKTEYYFYPDMIDGYRDGDDCSIYGDMVNPKSGPFHNCTNTTRWFKVSNATFVRYQDK